MPKSIRSYLIMYAFSDLNPRVCAWRHPFFFKFFFNDNSDDRPEGFRAQPKNKLMSDLSIKHQTSNSKS